MEAWERKWYLFFYEWMVGLFIIDLLINNRTVYGDIILPYI